MAGISRVCRQCNDDVGGLYAPELNVLAAYPETIFCGGEEDTFDGSVEGGFGDSGVDALACVYGPETDSCVVAGCC